MKILHTADWHAGRTLRGVDRTPEIARALDEILGIARDERVDLILVAGDLFDTPNPSADAEAAVYEFFLRAAELKVPSVVIAGNHDSSHRLESVSGLLKRVNVRAVGHARLARDGGVLEVPTASGDTALVAALPFLSERRLVKAAQLVDGDVTQWRQKYREGMSFFVDRLASAYRTDTVNLMMLHTTLDGGELSGSEFKFFVTNAYTISPDSLPASAQYVALGHLHRPQRLREGPPVDYAGSVVQLDFGEAGEEKSVRIVEARPGSPAAVRAVPLTSGKPLKNATVDLEQLERRLEEFRGWPGYLKVRVRVDHAQPGLKDRVLGVVPNALAVEVEVRDAEGGGGAERPALQALSPLEAYERYYEERVGRELPPERRDAFERLFAEVSGDEADAGSEGADEAAFAAALESTGA